MMLRTGLFLAFIACASAVALHALPGTEGVVEEEYSTDLSSSGAQASRAELRRALEKSSLDGDVLAELDAAKRRKRRKKKKGEADDSEDKPVPPEAAAAAAAAALAHQGLNPFNYTQNITYPTEPQVPGNPPPEKAAEPPLPPSRRTPDTTKSIEVNPLRKMGPNPVEFGYQGPLAPYHWADLSQDWILCGKGERQSPVDLFDTLTSTDLPPLVVQYSETSADIIHSANTVSVVLGFGSTIVHRGTEYTLKVINFKTPGEHTVNGVKFPMEMTFIHQTAASAEDAPQTMIMSVFFLFGKDHKAMTKLLKEFPTAKDRSQALTYRINPMDFLPPQGMRKFYSYQGSLSTPPCLEGVERVVLRNYVEASQEQIGSIASTIGHENARPLQPTHNRIIRKSVN